MSCEKGAIDDFFFVRWIAPTVADTKEIVDDVRALRDALGRQVHYVAIIGPNVDPPGEDVRASMKSTIDEMLECCTGIHLVIEGKGFRRAMARSIGTGIFLLSKNRGRTFAHDTVLNALHRAGLDDAAATGVLARAREAGLLNPDS